MNRPYTSELDNNKKFRGAKYIREQRVTEQGSNKIYKPK